MVEGVGGRMDGRNREEQWRKLYILALTRPFTRFHLFFHFRINTFRNGPLLSRFVGQMPLPGELPLLVLDRTLSRVHVQTHALIALLALLDHIHCGRQDASTVFVSCPMTETRCFLHWTPEQQYQTQNFSWIVIAIEDTRTRNCGEFLLEGIYLYMWNCKCLFKTPLCGYF